MEGEEGEVEEEEVDGNKVVVAARAALVLTVATAGTAVCKLILASLMVL